MDQAILIKKTLCDWFVCKLCQIRLVAKDLSECLLTTQSTLDAATPEEVNTNCPLCLGILQNLLVKGSVADSFMSQLLTAVRKSGHTFQNLTLNVSEPPALLLRDYIVRLALMKRLQLDDKFDTFMKESIEPKTVWKKLMFQELCLQLGIQHDAHDINPLQIDVEFSYVQSDKECAGASLEAVTRLANQRPQRQRNSNSKTPVSRTALREMLRILSAADLRTLLGTGPPTLPVDVCTIERIVLNRSEPLLLAGRYNKFSRRLPQTPWLLDGERRLDSSVEELICEPLLDVVNAERCSFIAAGREDVDVRMLGLGRPFLVELINAKHSSYSTAELRALENKVNGLAAGQLAVRGLTQVERTAAAKLKNGEIEKVKHYSALIWSERPVDRATLSALKNLRDVTIEQATPIRVLHRRTVAVRRRIVHSLCATLLDEHHFRLQLATQAGTYIKEFVHGDLGRTQPDLGQLLEGRPCDILSLDVLDVVMDWPPSSD